MIKAQSKTRLSYYLEALEQFFVFFSLTAFITSGFTVFQRPASFAAAAENQSGSRSVQLLFLTIYFVCFLFSIPFIRRILSALIREKTLLIFIALILFSVFWCEYEKLTLRRSIALVLTTYFGLYLGCRYSLKEILKLLIYSFIATMFGSFLISIFLPNYGMEVGKHAGAWRGLFVQKNTLGLFAVTSSAILLLSGLIAREKKILLWSSLGLSIFLIVMCTSKTALVSLFVIIILIPIYRAMSLTSANKLITLFAFGIIFSGILLTLLVGNLEGATAALGKDATLSGRTTLWVSVIRKILERPFLGYGISGFWLGEFGESRDVWAMSPWLPNHAHNGWLDIALELGIIGLLVYLTGFILCFYRVIRLMKATKSSYYIAWTIILSIIVMFNVTLSNMLDPNSFFWMIYVCIVASSSQEMSFLRLSSNSKTLR
jgi:O-antigen ligase